MTTRTGNTCHGTPRLYDVKKQKQPILRYKLLEIRCPLPRVKKSLSRFKQWQGDGCLKKQSWGEKIWILMLVTKEVNFILLCLHFSPYSVQTSILQLLALPANFRISAGQNLWIWFTQGYSKTNSGSWISNLPSISFGWWGLFRTPKTEYHEIRSWTLETPNFLLPS